MPGLCRTLHLARIGLGQAPRWNAQRAPTVSPNDRWPWFRQLFGCQQLEPTIGALGTVLGITRASSISIWAAIISQRRQGWVHDKYVRQAGPRIATLVNGAWQGLDQGTHAPVMIWYSPDMMDWLRKNRSADGVADHPPPVPDGAIMVKEMFSEPASDCRTVDPLRLFPTSGAAIMIRDASASYDGWFWGWYGFGSQSGWTPDWPALPADNNSLPNMGFAHTA